MAPAFDAVDRLATRVNALREVRMRVAVVADALTSGPPLDAVFVVAGLLGHAGDAASGHRVALDAALLVLGDEARLGYQRRAELYAAAHDAGLAEVALLLFEAAPPGPGIAGILRHLDEERPLVPTSRPLTLGERKAIARGHRRDLLNHLLRDPHPDVVAILLDNPHLTESDVIRLAARRPMLPASLTAVALNDRWRVRPRIRRALVQHP
jgi:hypothetical protein